MPEEAKALEPMTLRHREKEYVADLGFTVDERFAITGTEKGFYFWSLPRGELAHFIENPFEQEIDFRLTPDGKSLLVVSGNLLKVWDLCKIKSEKFGTLCPAEGDTSHEGGGGGAAHD